MIRREHIPQLLLIAVFLAAVLYGTFQSRFLIRGPQLSISEPVGGAVTLTEPLLSLSGTTRHISSITLNDAPIFIDESGAFTEQLVVPPGYTIMTIAVANRFGRSKSHTIHLYRPYASEKETNETEEDGTDRSSEDAE